MDPQVMQMLVWVGVFILVAYFFIIRPRKKQEKSHSDMMNELKRGDRVTTIGGIKGEVTKVKEETVMVKVSDGVEIEFLKRAIAMRDDSK